MLHRGASGYLVQGYYYHLQVCDLISISLVADCMHDFKIVLYDKRDTEQYTPVSESSLSRPYNWQKMNTRIGYEI